MWCINSHNQSIVAHFFCICTYSQIRVLKLRSPGKVIFKYFYVLSFFGILVCQLLPNTLKKALRHKIIHSFRWRLCFPLRVTSPALDQVLGKFSISQDVELKHHQWGVSACLYHFLQFYGPHCWLHLQGWRDQDCSSCWKTCCRRYVEGCFMQIDLQKGCQFHSLRSDSRSKLS